MHKREFHLTLSSHTVNFKMKVILGLMVITCLLVAVSAQNCESGTDAEVTHCIGYQGSDYGDTCANIMIRYYNVCFEGLGVSLVTQSKPLCYAIRAL